METDLFITGECEMPKDRKSLLCSGQGFQREDPLQMLNAATAFKDPKIQCDACYMRACDLFIERSHAK